MSPLISVIVPIYNVEKYLRSCLQSIKEQTYKNLEVILVNDGSPDGSLVICNEFSKNDMRFVTYDKQNEGAALSRNFGIEKSNGEYLYFADADDVLESDMLEMMITSIESQGTEICVTNVFRGNDDNFVKQDTRRQKDCYSISSKSEKNNYILNNMLKDNTHKYAVWNRLFVASLIKRNKIFFKNHRYAEDLLFNIECIMKSESISYIHTPLYKHYVRDGSVSNAAKPDILKKLADVAKDCYYVFESNEMVNGSPVATIFMQLFFMGIYNEVHSNQISARKCINEVRYYCKNAPQFYRIIMTNKKMLKQFYNSQLYLCIIALELHCNVLVCIAFKLKKGGI